ncbi:V-type sodium ATP synthase subunit J [Fervidicella metallireducens AeB]|uniref:V-type sodium ATP synthase subunit J n=1 Tax=Fervidicella metallireducens AeB TaxID=1403537 RepID=A0A017RXD0_9CLOT|nr:TrkH family potassium uptake protein [Fervidicella metallireducens]EYE89438.1 V-type sodium ATP synthase subunit J [Fervidicella metallireducens AeB]
MPLIRSERRLNLFNLQPVQILAIGFATVILMGAILLKLPIATRQGISTPFLDCLFTATSAVCVTGLAVVDTGTYWSTFGQIVIMLLIQIGGLGFMTFASFFAVLLGKKISLKERLVMQEAYNSFNIQGMVKLMFYVIGITFSIEGVGAVLLATQFIPEYGLKKGIYYSIFHAVSAFCNAGFDLIGDFRSLTPYVDNTVITLTIGGLIVVGGLGFIVITELINTRTLKRLTLHTKVVLLTTGFLILAGTILFFIFEYNNPKTMGGLGLKGKILASLFASITPRTAGFNTIPLDTMTNSGKFLTIILMFIGASPGSTGGGIKTTTAMLIFLTVIAVIHGREDTELFKKRFGKNLVYKAFSIVTISMTLITAVVMILSVTEAATPIEIVYEAVSAFGTVGLTLGLTTRLTTIGKIIIVFTMYIGRVGPLTFALAIAHRQLNAKNSIRYPEDKIIVG